MRNGMLLFPETQLEGSFRFFSKVDRTPPCTHGRGRQKYNVEDIYTWYEHNWELKSERGNQQSSIISCRLTCYFYDARHENRAVSNAHGFKRFLIQETTNSWIRIHIYIYNLFRIFSIPSSLLPLLRRKRARIRLRGSVTWAQQRALRTLRSSYSATLPSFSRDKYSAVQ